jgi:hypothetical protein
VTKVLLVFQILVNGGLEVYEVPYTGTYAMCSMSKMQLVRDWIEKNSPAAQIELAKCRIIER